MRVSLERFLRTGRLGDLEAGMSAEQVRALLGEPDAVGGTSRKYTRPCVWLYGSAEVYFRQQPPHDFLAVLWDAGEKGPFRLPAHCIIEDWTLLPGMARPMVESSLRNMHLAGVEVHEPPQTLTAMLVLSSGVQISFDEYGRLYSIHSGPFAEQENRK
jgi:hypothetical protein